MAKPINGNDEVPGERDSNRIRAFLAKVRPLSGNEVCDDYWEGRALIEALAVAFDVEDDAYHWDSVQCATVVNFMTCIEPVEGSCFCNDDSHVNATCGLQAVFWFMANELRRLAPKAKGRKRAAEVAP